MEKNSNHSFGSLEGNRIIKIGKRLSCRSTAEEDEPPMEKEDVIIVKIGYRRAYRSSAEEDEPPMEKEDARIVKIGKRLGCRSTAEEDEPSMEKEEARIVKVGKRLGCRSTAEENEPPMETEEARIVKIGKRLGCRSVAEEDEPPMEKEETRIVKIGKRLGCHSAAEEDEQPEISFRVNVVKDEGEGSTSSDDSFMSDWEEFPDDDSLFQFKPHLTSLVRASPKDLGTVHSSMDVFGCLDSTCVNCGRQDDILFLPHNPSDVDALKRKMWAICGRETRRPSRIAAAKCELRMRNDTFYCTCGRPSSCHFYEI